MRHHLHLLAKMREKGWGEREIDYARHVMADAHASKSVGQRVFESSLFWLFLIIIGVGNVFIISSIMPLLVLFPNPAIYGVLMLLGVVVGLLTDIVLRDIEHLLGGHHRYLLYIFVPFMAVTGGLVVLTVAADSLPNYFYLARNPLKMSIIYTIFFVLPIGMAKITRRKSASIPPQQAKPADSKPL